MPWFALDTHYLDDPKIQAAGEMTPFALSAFPALLAEAKQRANGGKVEVSYRQLAHLLFVSIDEAQKAVEALLLAGVLEPVSAVVPSAPQLSGGSIQVRFMAWRKWNERSRKAVQRGAETA